MRESQSNPNPNPNLHQLIDDAHEAAIEQQTASPSNGERKTTFAPLKTIFGVLLLVAFAVVVFVQYPRMQSPYAWPDPNASSIMAEADLEAVASLIEAYRISQGQYPAVLSQVALPAGLASLVAGSVMVYSPTDTAFTLDWTLPHWHATYDSKTGRAIVEPVTKR